MAAGDPEQFVKDVAYWRNRAEENLIGSIRAVIRSLVRDIEATTPVDTGVLKSSYYAARNSREPRGAPGGGSLGNVIAVIDRMKLGDSFTMANVAPYALRVEFGFVGQDSIGRNYNQLGRYWVAGALARHQGAIQGVLSAING